MVTHEQIARMTITQVINRANKKDPRITTYAGASAIELNERLLAERRAWEGK